MGPGFSQKRPCLGPSPRARRASAARSLHEWKSAAKGPSAPPPGATSGGEPIAPGRGCDLSGHLAGGDEGVQRGRGVSAELAPLPRQPPPLPRDAGLARRRSPGAREEPALHPHPHPRGLFRVSWAAAAGAARAARAPRGVRSGLAPAPAASAPIRPGLCPDSGLGLPGASPGRPLPARSPLRAHRSLE